MDKKKRTSRHVTCYMCNRPSTSKEHVPPLCFFPEEDELPGSGGFRKNLITVPSCDKHNIEKSADDQYLCTVLAIHFENNPIAQTHFSKKIMRALRRKPAMIIGFFQNLMPAVVRGSQSAVFHVDRPRFDRAIDHIARGVYLHHFNDKYTGKTDVMSYSLFDVSSPNRQRVNIALQEWRQYSDTFLATQPRFGNNQAVFYYQTVIDADTQRVGIRLVFYEGFVTDVYFRDPRSINSSAA